MTHLRIATRGSALARWQAEHVAALIRAEVPSVETELVIVSTTGDQVIDQPLWQIGGQGVFVKEVQEAVLDGRADIAVHSAKDLPSAATPGLVMVAVPLRADPRDAMVGSSLADLPSGAVVATGSVRRQAQIAAVRPDITFASLRGNMHTRIEKAGTEADAVVVAAAALDRLGLESRIAERFSLTTMMPQVGQGAIAIEAKASDQPTKMLVKRIHHRRSGLALVAERGFLGRLGTGCDLPLGALARVGTDGGVRVDGVIASRDGHVIVRDSVFAKAGYSVPMEDLGARLADRLLHLGGQSLLDQGLIDWRSAPA